MMQRGFTILELLISLVIGLIILGGVIKIFTNSKIMYNFNHDFSKMQEDIRFLNEYLPMNIKLAGHRAAPQSGAFPTYDTTFSTIPYISGANGTNTASDAITIAYQGSSNSTGVADGKIKDCLNQDVKATTIVTNKFFLEDAKLKCEVNNPDFSPAIKKETLISGVENFQIVYGEDVNGDGVPDRYLNANHSNLQMNRVVSVRIKMLLKSENAVNLFSDNKQYTLFDLVDYQPGGTTGDKYIRIPIGFTILLRNLVPR